MKARTKLSAKGQVVIPKSMREQLGLTIGESFEVVARGDDLLLRRARSRRTMTADEAQAEIRKIIDYRGPPVPVEKLSWHILDEPADVDESSHA